MCAPSQLAGAPLCVSLTDDWLQLWLHVRQRRLDRLHHIFECVCPVAHARVIDGFRLELQGGSLRLQPLLESGVLRLHLLLEVVGQCTRHGSHRSRTSAAGGSGKFSRRGAENRYIAHREVSTRKRAVRCSLLCVCVCV